MAVLAPMPTARESTIKRANTRSRSRPRIACRISVRIVRVLRTRGCFGSQFECRDPQAAVIGGPPALVIKVRRGVLTDQAEELRVLGRIERFHEPAAEHTEPVPEAALAILQRSGSIEKAGEGDFHVATLEDRRVLRHAREIPGIEALRFADAQFA